LSTPPTAPPGEYTHHPTTPYLPIFFKEYSSSVSYYTPGFLVNLLASEREGFELALVSEFPTGQAALLRQRATHALKTWEELLAQPFAPLCLTLYLNNACNLSCTYCFSNPGPVGAGDFLTADPPSLAAIQAAAESVATNCRLTDHPFTLVLHGGGEPTLDQEYIAQVLDLVSSLVEQYDLHLFRYIATNGVMSASLARWLGQNFDLVGLSCDGPERIQASQRPLRNGQSSTPYVVRTARILHDMGTPLHVRATITPASSPYQAEIADYLCQQLQPQEIHVEPVYTNPRSAPGDLFTSSQAASFSDHFLHARQVAQGFGIPWSMSGCRPQNIHGPYCQVLRSVLHLLPGDGLTACFMTSDTAQARQVGTLIGTASSEGRLLFDAPHLQAIQHTLQQALNSCPDCPSQYHCARACPDHCPLTTRFSPQDSFRCLVNRTLLTSTLDETSLHLQDQLLESQKQPIAGTRLVTSAEISL
jgi:sulfatase maturation enzyme AslB (radical SAM superfamily)